MIQDVAFAGQIEIGMLREVQHRVLIRGRCVLQLQRVVLGKRISRFDRQGARVAFLAIFACVAKLERWAVQGRKDSWLPDHLIEALKAAMQGIGTVIDRQRVFLAVERKLALGDPVPVTPDHGAKVGAVLNVIRQVVVAEHHIIEVAVPVGHLQEDHQAAVIDDAGLRALVIPQREQGHGSAVLHLAEGALVDLPFLSRSI